VDTLVALTYLYLLTPETRNGLLTHIHADTQTDMLKTIAAFAFAAGNSVREGQVMLIL